MQPSALRDHRRWLAIVALSLGTFVALGGYFSLPGSGPRVEKRGGVYLVVDDEGTYTFDAVWRVERMYGRDERTGRELAQARPDAGHLARMRKALLESLDVRALDQIPAEGKADLDAYRALGYL